jgi:gluconolactonase
MSATEIRNVASRVPGPPELLPGKPDAIVDLQTRAGAELVGATWRYADARVEEIEFVELGTPEDPLGPGTVANRTYDVVPHAEAADYDDSEWRILAPEELMLRLGNGRVSFNWYRTTVTLPEQVGDTVIEGATVVFETVVDDYAEVWVNGALPIALGDLGGNVAAGFNAPNRVVLTRDARPGETFTIAVFGINGPISASPRNYIWMRTATLDVYAAGAAPTAWPAALEIEGELPFAATLERLAGGFEFTEGPVWRDGALLFSSPNTNSIYRWRDGVVTVFRPKAGYTGVDIGRFHQPGSNGLAYSPEGLLTICRHGSRDVIRVNPHGDTTVLADAYEGGRLNSPNDLVYASDGTLYFTDPPFGLRDEEAAELGFGGVYRVDPDGRVTLVIDDLAGPNGVALSPDERYLYVGDWDPEHKAVIRYELATGARDTLCDLTLFPGEDAIDGLAVAPDGGLFVCGPGGLWFVTAAGEPLALLRLPEAPHNVTFGDDDRTLFITALTSVYQLRLEER